MSYLVLARKYRPQSFDQIVGQEHVTQTLCHAIESERVAHALIFSGPRGTGKTTIARILAKSLNCINGPTILPCNDCKSCREITQGIPADVFEIDGASNNSVDQIRELRENARYMPSHGRYKIYIIDEVHMLSLAAFNALLKTLEEPPPHVKFMFATTEIHKVPVTILSRCQRHDLKRIEAEAIRCQLEKICSLEQVRIPENCLKLIAREADGSMRDALSLLDQIISFSDGEIRYENLMQLLGLVDRTSLFDFSGAILTGRWPDAIDQVQRIYRNGQDIKRFYGDLLEHFRNLLVISLGTQESMIHFFPPEETTLLQQQTQSVPPVFLHQIADTLYQHESLIRTASNPRLALEMILFKLAEIRPVLSIDNLVESLEKLRNELSNKSLPPMVTEQAESYGPPPESVTPPSKLEERVPEPPSRFPLSLDILKTEAGVDVLRKALQEKLAHEQPFLAGALSRSGFSVAPNGAIAVQPENGRVSLEKIQKNLPLITQALSEIFQQNIQFVIQKPEDSPPQPVNPTAQKRKAALNHPRVAEALSIFGGNVVDIQIPTEE